MKFEPIFFNPDWDEASQKLFWETLKKKRDKKLFYALRKAQNLSRKQDNGLNQAIALLLFFVEDFLANEKNILSKNKYPRLYINDISDFCLKIANWYCQIGDLEKTEEYGNLAAKIYESYAGDTELGARRAFDGYLMLADIFMDRSDSAKASFYLNKFDNTNDKNDNEYPYLKALSRLAILNGNWSEAEKGWQKFYRNNESHNTFSDLEKHPYINVMEEEESDPLLVAEAIVVYHHTVIPEIFDKNRISLEKLDGLLKGTIKTDDGEDYSFYGYSSEFTDKHLLPELGAYLGEVWLKSFGGQWLPDKHLMKFRIAINGKIFNPFEYAYKALYYGYRLHEECFSIL
jgi:hypothetical protein